MIKRLLTRIITLDLTHTLRRHTTIITLRLRKTTLRRIRILITHMQLTPAPLHLTTHHVKINTTNTPRRLTSIQIHLGTITNLRNQRRRSLHRTQTTRTITRIKPIDRRINHKVIQRLRPGNQRTNSLITLLNTQITRIKIILSHRHKRLRQKRRIKPKRMQRRLLTSRITIKRKHNTRTDRLPINLQRPHQLNRTQRIILHQTTNDLRMLLTKRSTTRGNSRIHPGQMHGHHIGIPLDNHRLTLLHNRLLGQINAIQHLILVIQLRIRRIDILRRNLIIVIQLARTKPQRTPRRITNRPRHTPTEIVIHATLPLTSQSRIQHLLLCKPLRRQITHQIIPTLRRIAATEALAVGLGEGAAAEQLARGERLLGHDLADEEALCGLVRLQQTGALGTGVLGTGRTVLLVVQFDMVFVRKQLHRLAEVDVLLFLDEFEHVAAQTAAKTMPYAERRPHVEAAGLLVVERAQAHEGTGSRRLQRH